MFKLFPNLNDFLVRIDPSRCGSDYSAACETASNGKYLCRYPGTTRCFEYKWSGGVCGMHANGVDINHPLCPNL